MRVRMKVGMSGTRDGAEWPPKGGEVDLPGQEAADLVAAGLATPAGEGPAEEQATAPATAEKAVPPRRRAPAKKSPKE